MRPDAVATLRFFGRGDIAQSPLPCASVEIDASASLRARAQASQHTSTVLPPSLTFIAVASSLQSQAAQVFAVMVSISLLSRRARPGMEEGIPDGWPLSESLAIYKAQRRWIERWNSAGVRP